MTELSEVLERLGLLQYLGRLNDEGFDKWETVLDITEADLATLNFKLGHRRILQREIASARGVSATQSLASIGTQFCPVEEYEQLQEDRGPSPKTSRVDAGKGLQQTSTGKRKYRRHPKTDENAPEKPPSAYVMFANRIRDELKGQNLSFTEIAKLVGERWKVLAPEDKESYEYQASAAKDKFNAEFEEYKKTENYRDYIKYLVAFKSKMAKDGKEFAEQSDMNMKRPKLEHVASIGSSAVVSTTGSGVSENVEDVSSSGLGGFLAHSSSIGKSTHGPSSGYSSPLSKVTSTSPSTRLRPVIPWKPPTPPNPIAIAKDLAIFPPARNTQSEAQQKLQTISAAESDNLFFPRLHPTTQNPHIQQQSSYLRHQPPLPSQSGGRLGGGGSGGVGGGASHSSGSMVFPGPAIRRQRTDEVFSPLSVSGGSVSSSGSSSAPSAPSVTPLTPSLTSIEECNRSHHRALPLPSPSVSYFDHTSRAHHHQRQPSQPQSPLISLPMLAAIEPRNYSPTLSPAAPSNLPPPPTPRPPSG